jgi:hypothetical protein
VTVGPFIPTIGMTLDDLPALKARVRNEIVTLREKIRPLSTE